MPFTTTNLKSALETQFISMGVPDSLLTVTAEEVRHNVPDKDPQSLFVNYSSLYEKSAYLKDIVKIEIGVRTLKEPYTTKYIQSILHEVFPNMAYAEKPLEIAVVDPVKTFLEKAFLLHGEFLKQELPRIRIEAMSRHFYDLVKLSHTEVAERALNDSRLYETIRIHLANYNRLPWVDYQTLKPAALSFVPPDVLLEAYRKDYLLMQEQMIYGEQWPFDKIIDHLRSLNEKFRRCETTVR